MIKRRIGYGLSALLTITAYVISASGTGYALGTSYTSPYEYELRLRTNVLAVGDFDGDDYPDMVTSDDGDGALTVILGGATQQIDPDKIQTKGYGFAVDIKIADVNGDGHNDLISANRFGGNVTVFYNNGSGAFNNGQTFNVPLTTRAIATGDMNNDGSTDIVLAGNSGKGYILYNDGSGNFPNSSAIQPGIIPNTELSDVAVADFNNDGNLDVVCTNINIPQSNPSASVTVVYGDGHGGFSAPQYIGASPDGALRVVAQDVTNDGNADIVLTDTTSLQVLKGNGAGGFTTVQNRGFAGSDLKDVTVGDYNDDGKQDIALTETGFDALYLLKGDNSGVFAEDKTFTDRAAAEPAIADLNHDGHTDIVFLKLGPNGLSEPSRLAVYWNGSEPVIGAITVANSSTISGQTINFQAPFSDLDVANTHTAVWNWGDGTSTTAGSVSETNGSGSVTGSHVYSTPGVYPVSLKVTDNTGLSKTQQYNYVYAYHPAILSMFSGSGTYDSPFGSVFGSGRNGGPAQFSFNFRYLGNQPVAIRTFSMSYPAGNVNFASTSVSNLVISNDTATVRGTGTINGTGNYNFVVVGNKTTKHIRIRITDPASTNILGSRYDTQGNLPITDAPNLPLTSGNITVISSLL